MKNPTIFISYNPRNNDEQTLAIRLHTIGAVNGFNMLLPDRYHSTTVIDDETKRRINSSDYFILFSFGSMSNLVSQEINAAHERFNDKSRIIIIKPALRGAIKEGSSKVYTEIFFNPKQESVDSVIKRIVGQIFKRQNSLASTAKKAKDKEFENGILALLGVGLGLYALNEIFKSK